MDPQLYTAAQSGNWEVIKEFDSQLQTELTAERNTVLHVLAQFCDSSFAVEQILQGHPELLQISNAKGETALHIAARKGHLNVIPALIARAKHSREEMLSDMLCSQSKTGNLPLHEAVQNNHGDIVDLLVQEDPSLVHQINNANESPLYLAVEKGYHSLAAVMLSGVVKPSSSEIEENLEVLRTGDGPDMKSILHAAAIQNSKDCTQVILEKLPHLTKEVDKFGWTPLHYAARFNYLEVARELLNRDGSMANVKYKRNVHSEVFEEKTALHVAVAQGYLHLVEEILSSNRNCWEIVTDQGKNAIHLAVENEQKQVLDFILGKPWASVLINRPDIHGNTPLHLYVTARNLLESKLTSHPDVDRNVTNNAGLTPLGLIKISADQISRKQIELETETANNSSEEETNRGGCDYSADDHEIENVHVEQKTLDVYAVVTTLILTISFAAAFTIPGGFDTNDGPKKGLAVFAKKKAFQAYLVCIALAMCSSWVPVVMLINGSFDQDMDFLNDLVAIGLSALMIAFSTGLYVTIPILGIRIFLTVFVAVFGYCCWGILRIRRMPDGPDSLSRDMNLFLILWGQIAKTNEKEAGCE